MTLNKLLQYTDPNGPHGGNADTSERSQWQYLLEHLTPYPLITHPYNTTFAEAFAEGPAQPSSTSNYDYPIVHYAAIWPAQQIGLGSSPELFDIARSTIPVVNGANNWKPMNGLCLAWPPAARLTRDGTEGSRLLDLFTGALHDVVLPNGWPELGGGGLEQIGALDALHVILMQSHEGVIRLFAGWPRDVDAQFANLRADGAFLVSAKMQDEVVVSPVYIKSEVGRNCVVSNPFLTTVCVVQIYPQHKIVETHVVGYNMYMFETEVGGEYELVEICPRF